MLIPRQAQIAKPSAVDIRLSSYLGVLHRTLVQEFVRVYTILRTLSVNVVNTLLLSRADELATESQAIPSLAPADTLTGSERFHFVQNGESVQGLLSALAQYIKTAQTIVPASEPFKGALLRRTSNLNGVSFPLFVPWQEAVYDSDSFWSGGAATRITIPAGITKVRLTGSVRFNPTQEAGSISCRIYKNGAIFPFSSSIIQRQGEIGWDDNANGAFTPVVPVVAGDFFELRANRSGLASMVNLIQNVDALFFSVEVIERA